MWYNDDNSIIISKDENELKDAIDYILKNYNEKFNYQNRRKIRDEHISKQKMFRKVFTDYVKPIFESCGIEDDPEEVLKTNFSNKMLNPITISN
jgi:hypothetical protein